MDFLNRVADPTGMAAFTARRTGGYADGLIKARILGSTECLADVHRSR
jgi:hypothetical protein